MRVIFAPDWRGGVPYQELLGRALESHGVTVEYLRHYKRVFPLARSLPGQKADILHLHWPEAYYPNHGDAFDLFRSARFTFDLAMAIRKTALVTTAHNLVPHSRSGELFAHHNMREAFRRSRVTFCHSSAAKNRLMNKYKLGEKNMLVIPHGDLSTQFPRPIRRWDARLRLGLGNEPTVLMFGTIKPYKGVEEIIAWWRKAGPEASLILAGKPLNESYARSIKALAADDNRIRCHLQWLSDEELHLWLSASDAILFNYCQIFTSGAASLARSLGIPILLPHRLDTLDLGEPSPYVVRFNSLAENFAARLSIALSQPSNFEAAAPWRAACSWDRVAKLTLEGYLSALGRPAQDTHEVPSHSASTQLYL